MNLTLQDLLAILGPVGTLIGFMWYHFNNRFEKIDQRFGKVDEKIDNLRLELKGEITRLEEKLGEKIDAVRDRVSRIEGQLVPTKIIAFEETRKKKPKEIAEQGITEQKSARK